MFPSPYGELYFITTNAVTQEYKLTFPSPYGELYSITRKLCDYVFRMGVSVPLRGALFHNMHMLRAKLESDLFPSPYGEHYSITWRGYKQLQNSMAVSVPLRGALFHNDFSTLPTITLPLCFRLLTGSTIP